MKYLVPFVIIMIAVCIWICKQPSDNKTNHSEFNIIDSTDYTKQNEELFSQLKKEKQVLKVDTFKSAVLVYLQNDGTKRGNYASAMCNVVKETGSKNIKSVWVMQNGSENKKENTLKQGRIMGMCDCETFEITY